MNAIDVSGVLILGAGAVIAVSELVLTAWVWALPPIDPCAERPSSLPDAHMEAE